MPNMTGSNYSSEKAVIALAQKGDGKAFEQLYTAHKRRVYSLCVRMTRGNSGLAEELMQEAFLQVHRKIQTFRGESAFSTWLHRLVFNIVMMRLRRAVVQEVPLKNCSHNRRMMLQKRSSAATICAWRVRQTASGSKEQSMDYLMAIR